MNKKNNTKNSATDDQLEKVSGGEYAYYQEEDGTFTVYDEESGEIFESGLESEDQALNIISEINY